VIPGHEITDRAGSGDRFHLSSEVELGGAPPGLMRSRKSAGVRVVTQEENHPLPGAGGKLLSQCHEHRLAQSVGCAGIPDQV
jgi:hypothetical protein